jgi:type I restriction enzyme S subunit
MNELKELPERWKWVKLGEACEIVSGNTPKGLELISNSGFHQFYKVSDMNLVGNEIQMNVSNLRLTIEDLNRLKVKTFPKGTVIFPKRGGAILTNKKRILSQNASFDLNLMGLLPNDKLTSSYLFYWIQKLDLSKIYDGSNVPQINNKNVAPLDFPLPPLSIQQAIVSKIEELFSELDKGVENLKTAQQQLKVYKQAVLKWAFEGKLTNGINNDANDLSDEKDLGMAAEPDAVYQTTKNQENHTNQKNQGSDNEGLPEGWEFKKLKKLARLLSGYAFKSSSFITEGVPVIKIANIGYCDFVWKAQQFLPNNFLEANSNFKVKGGDLLIALTRPITNNQTKVCHYPVNAPEGLLNQRVACIKDLKMSENFVFFYFQTETFKKYIRSKFSETLQPNLSPKDLLEAKIPYCSLNEQNQVVEEIERRLSVADKMEESIQQSLLQAESLRQSILKKAFEGGLMK